MLVGLLDASVRVIHRDSLKVHLTLYGHKLPVLCVGASSDGTICASGSADKSVKLWGLDFGDMHRSLRAHTEPVTALAWVPRTHYLFTAGKARRLASPCRAARPETRAPKAAPGARPRPKGLRRTRL